MTSPAEFNALHPRGNPDNTGQFIEAGRVDPGTDVLDGPVREPHVAAATLALARLSDADLYIAFEDLTPERKVEFFTAMADQGGKPELWAGLDAAGIYGPIYDVGNTREHLSELLENDADFEDLEMTGQEMYEMSLAASIAMKDYEPGDDFYQKIGSEIDDALRTELQAKMADRCRTEGCGAALDDGEGSNGFCGDCADRLACTECSGEICEDVEDVPADKLCDECRAESE